MQFRMNVSFWWINTLERSLHFQPGFQHTIVFFHSLSLLWVCWKSIKSCTCGFSWHIRTSASRQVSGIFIVQSCQQGSLLYFGVRSPSIVRLASKVDLRNLPRPFGNLYTRRVGAKPGLCTNHLWVFSGRLREWPQSLIMRTQESQHLPLFK